MARRHAEVLGTFDDVAVGGVVDVDRDAAATLASELGIPAYDGVSALLDGVAPDAVYVCVPPFAHGEPERALVAAGVPFFVEKPLSVGLDVAEDLGAAIAARGLVTATGYHWRYMEGMRRARAALAERPVHLVVGAWHDKVPPPAWWIRAERSGGQVVEQATHLLDCMLDLAGDIEMVCAVADHRPPPRHPGADVDAATVAVLRFANGAVGTLSATSVLPAKQRASVELLCDGCRLEVAETRYVGEDGVVRDEDADAAKRLVDRAFVDAVQGRPGGVLAPYDAALRTHRVASAIARSAVDGRPIELTPVA